MNEERTREAAERWGVTLRTVRNWLAKGEAVGEAPPMLEEDPRELVEWYRRHHGREPGKKVREAAARMTGEVGPGPVKGTEDAAAPMALIREALARLGLSLSIARVAEEADREYNVFVQCRKVGDAGAAAEARRRWREASEMHRAQQKSQDSVAVALELLKDWVRGEWMQREMEVRAQLVELVGEDVVEKVFSKGNAACEPPGIPETK